MIEALYLLGTMAPGLWGGCAITVTDGYPMLECTYGAVAECSLDTLGTCQVPVYAWDLSGESEPVTTAIQLVEYALQDPRGLAVLGKPWISAPASVITAEYTSARDYRDHVGSP